MNRRVLFITPYSHWLSFRLIKWIDLLDHHYLVLMGFKLLKVILTDLYNLIVLGEVAMRGLGAGFREDTFREGLSLRLNE
jgi:multisubunit Na+/H+ antiporter MnhB subunit